MATGNACNNAATNTGTRVDTNQTTVTPTLIASTTIDQSSYPATANGDPALVYDYQRPYDIFLYTAEPKPNPLVVPAGTRVIWKNMSEHDYGISGGGLLIGTIEPLGGTSSYTFTQPGTYWYDIDPYPNMTGQVIVVIS